MTELAAKIALLEKIAKAWRAEKINFAVAHGLEAYPTGIGRDLDIFIERKQLPAASDIVREILRENGCYVVMDRKDWAWWIIGVYIDKETIWSIEIDLVTYMNWGPAMLVDAPRPAYQIGPFEIDPWASFVKRVFIQILGGNIEKFRTRKQDELCVRPEEQEAVRAGLTDFMGVDFANRLIEWVDRKDYDALQAEWPTLRKQLTRRTLQRRPFSSVKMAFIWLQNELALSPLSRKPAIPAIALVGPDGVGKSTVLNTVRQRLPKQFPFTKVHVKHWRPGLLPPLKLLLKGKLKAPAHDGQAVMPRREAGKFRLLRLLYYFFDFWLGWHIMDKPRQATLQLILYDRCALDMEVDPVRFGLSSGKGVRRLWRNSPHPDAVILLHDTPERIYARKPELTQEEIANQLQRWMALYEQGVVSAVVKVDDQPDIIAGRIERLVIDSIIRLNNAEEPV